VRYIVDDASLSVVFVGDQPQYDIARKVQKQIPSFKQIVIYKDTIKLDDDDSTTMRWGDMLKLGEAASAACRQEVQKRRESGVETDLCYLGGFPGNRLKDVFGLTADEIDTLYPADKNTVLWNGQTYDVIDYCELITPTTAESLGYYGADFYKGMPALLKNSYRSGMSYYIGCRDTGELTDKLYATLLQELKIKTYDLPEGVTIATREQYLFVQNFNDHPVTVTLAGTYRNVETGEVYDDTAVLSPCDVIVVTKS
jgi:beta-galactosidase GanA